MKHFGRENEGQCRSTCKHVASPHFSGMQVLGTEWRRHIPLFPGCLMERAGGPSIEQLGIASSPSFWWRPELSACGVVFPVPGPGAPGALAEPRPPPTPTHRAPPSLCCCLLPIPAPSRSSVGSFQRPAPLGLVKTLYQCPSLSAGVTFSSAVAVAT